MSSVPPPINTNINNTPSSLSLSLPATPTTEVTPSITLASTIPTSLANIEPLEKSKNNWPRWKQTVLQCLQFVGLSDYLHGTVPQPDAVLEPRAHRNWGINNGAVIAFLGLKASEEEQEFIDGKTIASEIWTALRVRHEQEGPIAQILLIQQALDLCYSKSERLSSTSIKLADLVARIYAIW